MSWFKGKDERRVRFIAMLESGQLYDGHAITMQTQVIADEVHASIRNRKPVPIYYHREEGSPPVWGESAHIESGLARPPGDDARYLLSDALHLWKAFKSGIESYTGGWSLSNKHLALASYVVAGLFVLCCLYLTSLNLRPESPPDVAGEETDHGFIDELEIGRGAEGESGEGGGEPAGGPGREGGESGAQQPLATGDGQGAEGDTAQGARASP